MRMRRCSVAHCVCKSDWNHQISWVCILLIQFTFSICLLKQVTWDGGYHQFCFCVNALSFSAMPVQRQPLRLLAPLTRKDIEAKKKARRLHLLLLAQHLCWFYLTKALQEVKARESGPAPSQRPRKDIAANHTFFVFSVFMRCSSLVKLETFQSWLVDVLLSR